MSESIAQYQHKDVAALYRHQSNSESYRPRKTFIKDSAKQPTAFSFTPLIEKQIKEELKKVASILDHKKPDEKSYLPEWDDVDRSIKNVTDFSWQLLSHLKSSYFGEQLHNECIKIHKSCFSVLRARVEANRQIDKFLKDLVCDVENYGKIDENNIGSMVTLTKKARIFSHIKNQEVIYRDRYLGNEKIIKNFSKIIKDNICEVEKKFNKKMLIKDVKEKWFYAEKDKHFYKKTEDLSTTLVQSLSYSHIVYPNENTYMASFNKCLDAFVTTSDGIWNLERLDLQEKKSISNLFISFIHSAALIDSHFYKKESYIIQLDTATSSRSLRFFYLLQEFRENLNLLFTYLRKNEQQNGKILDYLANHQVDDGQVLGKRNDFFAIKSHSGLFLSYNKERGFYLNDGLHCESQWIIQQSAQEQVCRLKRRGSSFYTNCFFHFFDQREKWVYHALCRKNDDIIFQLFRFLVEERPDRFMKNQEEKGEYKMFNILDILSNKDKYPVFSEISQLDNNGQLKRTLIVSDKVGKILSIELYKNWEANRRRLAGLLASYKSKDCSKKYEEYQILLRIVKKC